MVMDMDVKLINITSKTPQQQLLKVEQDSQYVLLITPEQNEALDIEFTLSFEQPGVRGELFTFFVVSPGSEVSLSTISHHKAPNTSADTKVKGILLDNSSSNYHGAIKIDQVAQQTSSFLHDEVLVVGQKTKNKSEPVLEIEANDVRASHGATTGRIDDLMLFYLKSRGLSDIEARDVVVEGFFESLISQVTDEKVREQVREEILKSLKVSKVS